MKDIKPPFKKIPLFTFFSYPVYMEIEKNDPNSSMSDQWFVDQFKEWKEAERRNAVREYQEEQFLKEVQRSKVTRFIWKLFN